MLHFTNGDMFDTDVDIRVNTVNCVGVMGAGVALAFKTRYPAMFRDYKKACDAGEVQPGRLNVWRTLTEWIINFPTKRHWRENSRYEDVEDGLKALRQYLDNVGKSVRVALPALGCGHGGLDWSRVSKMIVEHLANVQAEIFVFEPSDSLRVGEMAASRRRDPERENELKPRTLRADERSFPAVLRRIDVHALTVVGDVSRLSQPMVWITLAESPTAKEEEAAAQCVEALARASTQLSFIVGGSAWRRLVQLAVTRNTEVLLWSVEPIRVETLQLQNELATGLVTVASIANDGDVWTSRAYHRTRQASLQASRAQLITDTQPDWLDEAPSSAEQRVFFVRYANSDAVERLLRFGARPIGRGSESKAPNIGPIISALRDDAADSR